MQRTLVFETFQAFHVELELALNVQRGLKPSFKASSSFSADIPPEVHPRLFMSRLSAGKRGTPYTPKDHGL